MFENKWVMVSFDPAQIATPATRRAIPVMASAVVAERPAGLVVYADACLEQVFVAAARAASPPLPIHCVTRESGGSGPTRAICNGELILPTEISVNNVAMIEGATLSLARTLAKGTHDVAILHNSHHAPTPTVTSERLRILAGVWGLSFFYGPRSV